MMFGALGQFALGQFDEAPSTAVLIATSGAYTITGQSAVFNTKIIVTAGSYTISGQAAVLSDKMVAAAGAYAITGQAAVLNPMLAAVAGSYVITGQGAVFAGRMPVTAGAYALTGQAATFRPIETVASGAYAIAGSPVIYNVTMACAAGAYALTGSLVAFTQVINGAGGYPNLYRGKLQLERRKIRITDDEGRSRKVDMLRHLKPPPPFAPAPDWVLDKAKAAPVRRPEPPAPMLPTVLPAPRLPESLTALQDARDENELVEFLTNTPDPLVEDIRQVLGVLASTGQLDRLLENA